MIAFHTVAELASALTRAEQAHKQYEAEGYEDLSWQDWYAEYLLSEQQSQVEYCKGLVSTVPVVDGSQEDLDNRYGKGHAVPVDSLPVAPATAQQGNIWQTILATGGSF
jgi:hypothetical protein